MFCHFPKNYNKLPFKTKKITDIFRRTKEIYKYFHKMYIQK